MRRALLGRRAARVDLEAALERGIEGLLAGNASVSGAAVSPEQAFAVRPLLDAATMLRAAFDEAPAAGGGRAELIAQLHWTPQQRPPGSMRLEVAGGALRRTGAAAAETTARALLGGTALVLALVFVGSLAPASSERNTAAATLTILAGSVEQQTRDGWQPLSDGASVAEGAHIRIGAGSEALLTFADGSVLNLGEHEDIEVPRGASDGALNLRMDERANLEVVADAEATRLVVPADG